LPEFKSLKQKTFKPMESQTSNIIFTDYFQYRIKVFALMGLFVHRHCGV
jgi:hypothetical protein